MVAGFIPDGEAMKKKNIKIGDWLRKVNSNNVTFQNLDQILSEITTPSNVRLINDLINLLRVYSVIIKHIILNCKFVFSSYLSQIFFKILKSYIFIGDIRIGKSSWC